jgi:tetratricopeptide (TPR) repeat protein
MRKSHVIRVTFSRKPTNFRARRRQMNSATLRSLSGLLLAATLVVCASLCIATAASAQKATKAEIQGYEQALKIKDPAAQVAALESFLENDPQSVNNVFVDIGDTIGDAALSNLIVFHAKYDIDDKTLSGVKRVLEVDPNNALAIYDSVIVRDSQCKKSGDPQSCNDAIALASKGLAVPKPKSKLGPNDWEAVTSYYQLLPIRIYQEEGEDNKALGAAERLLQMDPNNVRYIYLVVLIRKSHCEKTGDPQSCNDAIALAHRGLALPRPDKMNDSNWEKATALFQSVSPEWQTHNAATRADQQARYDKVMNGGRPAQLYALAGQLQAEGRPEMAADLYQALIDNFPDDPYTAKAIDKQEAMRAAAQQPAQPAAGQPAATDAAQQQAMADCQQQCSAALTACKNDAKGQVQTGVAMGVLGKLLKTTSVADSVTSVGSSAIDSFGACNDAYTSCTADCQ